MVVTLYFRRNSVACTRSTIVELDAKFRCADMSRPKLPSIDPMTCRLSAVANAVMRDVMATKRAEIARQGGG